MFEPGQIVRDTTNGHPGRRYQVIEVLVEKGVEVARLLVAGSHDTYRTLPLGRLRLETENDLHLDEVGNQKALARQKNLHVGRWGRGRVTRTSSAESREANISAFLEANPSAKVHQIITAAQVSPGDFSFWRNARRHPDGSPSDVRICAVLSGKTPISSSK